jgi:hypothetical protein
MKKTLLAAVGGLVLSASLMAGAQVVVRIGPPARVVETRPALPPEHRDWVWRNGYHRWDGNAYVWAPGEYVAPPHPHARWVDGRWEHRHGGWVWIEGRWR